MKTLIRLMTVPTENRDLAWIRESLQAAVQLEFSTIPPYLYAMWSIDRSAGSDPSGCRATIRGIVEEEMLHMGIACNALVAVGGAPAILDIAPEYPTQLPLHIHTGLEVGLAPLSSTLILDTFMAIEEPEVQQAEDHDFTPSGTTLIGDFYDGLSAAFDAVQPTLSTTGQLDLGELGNGAQILATLADVHAGIDLIKRQGEGSSAGPFENQGDTEELGHFYQFGEIFHGRKLTRTAPFTYTGDPVSMPVVRNVAPGDGSTPAEKSFDQAYSDMVGSLQSAWNGGPGTALDDAVGAMRGLRPLAEPLFVAGTGPGFRKVAAAGGTSGGTGTGGTVTEPLSRFGDVVRILDASVEGATFGAHGAFWRGMTRDEFVGHAVFGEPLLVVGKGSDSNLVKALRGDLPFGSDTGNPGADFRRMPAGRPAVAGADVDVVERWIDDGCPDRTVDVDDTPVSLSTGGFRPPESVHVEYFRDLDDWAMFNSTSETDTAIGLVFGTWPSWRDRALDPTKEGAWVQAISADAVVGALRLLSTHQRQTVVAHYGVPVPLLAVLDGYERFGNNGLPDDPLRPADPRHNMNGAQMWFRHASFADSCVQLGIAPNFWRFMMRAILCGLCNDGLFRGRFPVSGFPADPVTARHAVFEHAQAVADADLPGELARRFRESGL